MSYKSNFFVLFRFSSPWRKHSI